MAQVAGKRALRWSSRRRALPIAIPALAAAAALVVVAVMLLGRGSEVAYGAAVIRVAEAAPRLLVGEPGWQVTRADEFSVDVGEMTFSNGEQELELRWLPAREYEAKVDDRAASADLATTAPVAGTEARLFRYEGGANDFTALWLRGDYALELRGIAPDVEAFETLLASLHEVDVDSWLSAMPESVVKPASRAEVVEEMLADIPLPAGFDAGALEGGDIVLDRYQLGAQVAGAVACAWIERWVTARRTGDDAGVRDAATAVSTSHTWAILRQMNGEGDYPEVLWQYADAMATNAPIVGGKLLTIEESYRSALGCEGP